MRPDYDAYAGDTANAGRHLLGLIADLVDREAVERADEGYPRLQVKVGGRDVSIDIEVIRKVWEKVGGRMRLAVDANRGLTTPDALRFTRE